jgi:tRNA threonylcarbamoyladenosine biosynthesis protein TsaB
VLILTIRTDKPEAEIGLYNDNEQISYYKWEAHRQLAETIHLKIIEQLNLSNHDLRQVSGIIFYKGPGSFTGLRIGASVVNALASSLSAKIVGAMGEDWLISGVLRLLALEDESQIIPEYGAPVHITLPKH